MGARLIDRTVRVGGSVPCVRCGKPALLDTKSRLDTYRWSGRMFCGAECRKSTLSEESSARMAATNRRDASARMIARNPMLRADSRAKMSRTLKAIGHGPVTRGGNGRPAPVQQARLAEALGWPMEVIVPTGLRGKTVDRYPTHYKLDIADRDTKIAIEIDGASHIGARRVLDAKKDAFLQGRGWLVLRFTNDAIETDLSLCVSAVLGVTR